MCYGSSSLIGGNDFKLPVSEEEWHLTEGGRTPPDYSRQKELTLHLKCFSKVKPTSTAPRHAEEVPGELSQEE